MARLVLELDERNASRKARALRQELDRLGIEARVVGDRFDRTSRSTVNFGRALAAVGTVVATIGLTRLIREAVQAQIQFEKFEGALRVATGSAEAAGRELEFVKDQADRLGLPLESAAEAYAKLAAAARGTTLAGEDSRQVFIGIAEAGTVLNLTAEEMRGALTAVEQIISKGKVSAEELRGQLGERLPGAFQIAARSIGVTTAELDKLLSTGRLAADQLLPAFAAELRRTFGPEVENAAQNTLSQFNRLNNAILLLKQAAGAELAPAIGRVAAALTQLASDPAALQFFSTLGRVLADTIDFVVGLASKFGDLQAAILGFIGATARELSNWAQQLANIAQDNFEVFDALPEALLKVSPGLRAARNNWGALAIVAAETRDELLDFAINAEQAAADALATSNATRQLGGAMTDLGTATRETAAETSKLIRELEEASLRAFADDIERIVEGVLKLGTVELEVGSLLEGLTVPSVDEVFGEGTSARLAAQDFAKDLGRDVAEAVSRAIEQALASGDVDSAVDALGNALATAISAAVAGAVGGPLGAIAGGVAGGLFANVFGNIFGGGDRGPSLADEINAVNDRLRDFVSSSLPSLVSSVIDTFTELGQVLAEVARIGGDLTKSIEAANRQLDELRNQILGISTTLADRLQAALEFNRQLGLTTPLLGGAAGSGRGPSIGGAGGGGARAGGLEAFSESVQMVEEAAQAAGPEMINLAELANQLTLEFAGVNFEFLSVQATADALRDAINQLGLESDITARLLEQVTQAERLRMQELETDVLQRLANVLAQIPGMEQQRARLQAQIDQARFQVEVEMLSMQLRALGLMTRAFEHMLDVARQFGQELGNFQNAIRSLGVTVPSFPRGFGAAARRRARQDALRQAREGILDFLQGMAFGPTSALSPIAQFNQAQSQFQAALAAARGGDVEALRDLPRIAQLLLQQGRSFFGSSQGFTNLFIEVNRALSDLIGGQGALAGALQNENQIQTGYLSSIAGSNDQIVAELRRLRLVFAPPVQPR